MNLANKANPGGKNVALGGAGKDKKKSSCCGGK